MREGISKAFEQIDAEFVERADFKAEIASLKADLKTEIANLRAELYKALLIQSLAQITVIVALIKFL